MTAPSKQSEDEKTLSELQERIMEYSQILSRYSAQERVASSRKHRTELTLAELQPLPDTTRSYKAVGKAYFLASKATVCADAEKAIADSSVEIDSVRQQRSAVEQKMKEAQAEF
ncbi:uncharacterized protein HaLaN_15421, partial [Haematococcus lacustris]